MKFLLIVLLLTLSASAISFRHEHFRLNDELNCEVEFREFGCKRGSKKNSQNLAECLERNISDLSKTCLEVYRNNKKNRRI